MSTSNVFRKKKIPIESRNADNNIVIPENDFNIDKVFDSICFFGDSRKEATVQNRNEINSNICIPVPKRVNKCNPKKEICKE